MQAQNQPSAGGGGMHQKNQKHQMATSAQVPLNFKQIIASDKHLNINTRPTAAYAQEANRGQGSSGAFNSQNNQRYSNNSQSTQASKGRKQSAHRAINNMMQPIDSQVMAAALKQLGTVAAAGLISSASKERAKKTPQIQGLAQMKNSQVVGYPNEVVSNYAQGSQSSSNIQAKRNSKLVMTNNFMPANMANVNQNTKKTNNMPLDDYQSLNKSATAEKRRNFKSSTKTAAPVVDHHTPNLQSYYQPSGVGITSSQGIFHQQKRRVSSTSNGGGIVNVHDSQSLDHFNLHHNNQMMNTTNGVHILQNNYENPDEEEILRVEDYNNNQASQSYFTQQQQKTGPAALRAPSGFDDTEADYYPRKNSTSTLSKKKRYTRLDHNTNDYSNLEDDVRIPAFLIGRSSLENTNKDKGKFYMTQVFTQTNTKPQQSYGKGTSQSSTIKASKSGSKMKSTSKKYTSVTSSSAIAKQYALSTMKQLTTQQKLALLAGVGSSQNFDNLDMGFELSSQEFVRQQSAQKRTSTLMMSQTGLLQNPNEGFFNSTAPINMHKIKSSGPGLDSSQQLKDLDKVVVTGGGKIAGMLMMSQSKDSTSMPRHHSYYNSGSNLLKGNNSGAKRKPPVTLNTTHLDQSGSLSPLKHVPSGKTSEVTAKKQLLIQSLLNTKADNQPKALLNVTLQNLIQQQKQKNQIGSQEPPSKTFGNTVQRGLLSHNRLNKTLDNSSGGEMPPTKPGQSYPYPSSQGGTNQRGSSATRASIQKSNIAVGVGGQNPGSKKTGTNKMSSTMRINDFNQTQQIHEIKGQMQDEGRKSKISLKNTQNVIVNSDGAENDPRKQSVISIYTQQQPQNQKGLKKGKQSLNQNAHQKKPSNEHHYYDQNERDMLKKMMNFYQDDFLSHFNLKNPGGVEVPKVISKSGGQKTALSKQQSDKGVGYSQTKHKAHTTLNHYLQQNHQVMRFEPQIMMQVPRSPDIESEEVVLGHRKKDQQFKEFQNKTQPIPKNILEMGAQTGITGANISTGTNGVGNMVKGHGSIESEVVIAYPPKVDEPPKELKHEQKPIKSKQKQKQEDPAEVYANKRPQILEDDLIPPSSQEEQINSDQSVQNEDSDSDDSDDGNKKLAKFALGKQVGQGAYAVVRIASLKNDPSKKYAIKVYDKSKLTDINRQRSVRREIKLLQKMNHANIVKIFEAFETDDNVYLVMEYVGGGSLHSYLKEKSDRRLDEEDAKRIFKQIMTALQYCHRKSIAHRDIKLENILLDENNNVKLIDFGFSTCIPNDKKIKMFCGTPSYMAPEIVLKEEYAGPPADIWASAVLLYALLNGCFPYRGATDKELYRRIQRGTFVMHNTQVSESFSSILTRMLNVVADNRPSAEEILDDPWFTQPKSNGRKEKGDFSNDHAVAQAALAEQARAEERRAFKAKILGKVSIERGQGAIFLNGQDRNKAPVQISGSGTIAINGIQQNNNQNYQGAQNAPDFSDYGLNQHNVIKKLNQEAYQAYYNTSGANFGISGSGTIQNPYYNNFFQSTPFVNQAQHQQNNTGAYPGVYNHGQNQQLRGSPQKTAPVVAQQQQNHTNQGPFSNFTGQPPQLNNIGTQPQNQQTPQVFGSPTSPPAFHCTGGMINNNFNIINNIIMNPSQAVNSPPQGGTKTTTQPQQQQEEQVISRKYYDNRTRQGD